MGLNEYYQRIHVAWMITCYIFVDFCLEYSGAVSPWAIYLDFGIEREFVNVYHLALLPTEWLPFILIIWFIGHIVIWGKFKI